MWPLHGGVAQRHVPAGDEGDEGDEGDDDGEQVDGKPPEGDGAKPPKASMRWRLVEHLNDVVYAIKTTEGCLEYARDEEGLKTLAQPTYGVDTRWPYYIDASVGLAPATYRYVHFFAFLLHTWLVAEGHDGLDVVSAANEEHADEQIPRLCHGETMMTSRDVMSYSPLLSGLTRAFYLLELEQMRPANIDCVAGFTQSGEPRRVSKKCSYSGMHFE